MPEERAQVTVRSGGRSVVTPAAARRAQQGLVIILVLAAALLRVAIASSSGLSHRGDEGIYLRAATRLARDGPFALGEQVREFLAEPRLWIFPSPLRYGHYLTAAAAVRVWGEQAASLIRLSTLASIAALVLAALLVRRVAGVTAAAVAVGLLLVDPLWLYLGRRALVDAHHAALFLATVWAFFEATRPDARRGAVPLAVALLAWFVAVKESGTVLLATLAVVQTVRAVRERAPLAPALGMLALGGALALVGFSVLTGSPWAYLRVTQAMGASTGANWYLDAFHGGPPHRYLVDYAALSPVVLLLAPFGLARWLRVPPTASSRGRLGWTLAATAVVFGAFLLLVSCGPAGVSVRWLLPLDTLARLALGAWLASWALRGPDARARTVRAAVVAGVVVVNALVEGWIFRRVFVERGVYDPASEMVLRALGILR